MSGRESGEQHEVFTRTIPAELGEGASLDVFQRELAPATELANVHILPVLGAGRNADGLLCYTMRFAAGEWLPVRLRSGPLPLNDTIGILSDVANALDFAHRRGVVHGSLAPDKVILSFGNTIVTDFGVALALVRARGRPLVYAHVDDQPTIGDPAYLAPEQHRGTTITPAADVYAWGVLAYELLSGVHPFAARTSTRELMEAHATEVPVHLLLKKPGVPSTLSTLVMQCLEKDPEARPASVSELLRVLDDEALLGDAPDVSFDEPESPGWRTRIIGVLACVVAGLIVFGGPRLLARARGVALGDSAAAADSLTGTTAISAIAVLPFESPDGSASEYLTTGLTRELAHTMALVPRVRVAGAASSAAVKRTPMSVLQVAKTLGVGAVVSGSLQQSGTTIRARVSIVNAAGRELWSGAFERPAAELLRLQDDYTRGIVSAVVPGLKGDVAAHFASRGRGTEQGEAYDLFLQASHGIATGDAASVQRALGSLQRATQLDPSFTRASAALARAYLRLSDDSSVNRDSTLLLAVGAARRALSLDLASGDAHIALGEAMAATWRFAEAGVQFRSALEQVPGDAMAQFELARNLLASGNLDRAQVEARTAAAQDPLSPGAANLVALALLDARKFPETIVQARFALGLDSTYIEAARTLARAYLFSGHADSAVLVLEPAYARDSTASAVRATLFLAYSASGRQDDARRLRTALAAERAHPSDYDGLVLSLVDDNKSAALSALAQGAAHGGDIAIFSESLSCDPLLDKLKAEAQFGTLMGALGLAICPASVAWPVGTVTAKPGGG